MSYIEDVLIGKHTQPNPPIKEVVLFENKYQVYDHVWRNHVHIICSYKCNAACRFCVERNSGCPEEPTTLLSHTQMLLAEMAKAGILHTVSITGGEPTIYPYITELINIIKQFPVFLTINTNAARLAECLPKFEDKVDFINISRHHLSDEQNQLIFKAKVPTLGEIAQLKQQTKSKFRFQAVALDTSIHLEDYLDCVRNGIVDDISVRQLMRWDKPQKVSRRHYLALVKEALCKGSVVEQEIQDYYVYETHLVDNIPITFSYSDMGALARSEREEPANFIREFIIRPDGAVNGSWCSADQKRIVLV